MNNKPIMSLGVTLPELMTTVCIASVLIFVAVPNFMDMITSNRATSIANQLVTALAYARSEAIKRGQQVTIRHKGAAARVWEQGWDVFNDSNKDGVKNGSDMLLKTYEALPEGYTLRTGGNFASWVAYAATGTTRGGTGFANDTFNLCNDSKSKTQSRAIIIKMGRVRTETGKAKCP